MAACRESQNIFLFMKNGRWKRVWYLIKTFNKTTWGDSFAFYWYNMICKIKGHDAYQPDARNEPNEWACKRCNRWIPNYNLRFEKLKKLNKIK